MTIHARFLPKYPKRIDVNNGLTKRDENGIITLGFDYNSSEFGAELKQAVDSANSDAAATASDRVATQASQTAAAASAAASESWANIAETAVVNIDASFDLVSDAQAATIGATKKTVLTQGFTAIGRGGARYRRVATQPTHPGKLRSTDRFLPDGSSDLTNGGWWEIAEPIIDARMLGIVAGSNADNELANAIATAAGVGAPLSIPTGTYQFTKAVVLSPLVGSQIILGGNVIFDFSSATDASYFTGYGCVYVDGGALVRLPDLSANVVLMDSGLTFVSSPALSSGDRICIWNTVAGSFSGFQSIYYAGEFKTVADGSGGTAVKLYGTTYSDYNAANVYVYKHPNKSLSVTGGTITIIESRSAGFDSIAGLRADRIVDSDLSTFRPTQSLYAGIALKQCVGIFGTGYQCKMVLPAGGGTCYGLIYANCQDIDIQGEFNGGRHGVSGGGFGDAGSVPSRNVRIRGTFRNSPDAPQGIGGVGFHGNCEFCHYEGDIEGGITIGGNNNSVYGNISVKPSQNGLAVYFGDMVGTSFKIGGKISVSSAAAGTPVISIGALGSSPLTAFTKFGGVIDFSGIEFDCPNSQILIVIQNNAAAPVGPMIIDLSGAKWLRSAITPSYSVIVSKLGGNNFDQVLMDGFVNGPNAPYSIGAATKIRGWRQSGRLTLSPSTSASVITNTATINAPKAPNVFSSCPVLVGGSRASSYVGNVSATSVEVGAATIDGNNFASSSASYVNWDASIDD